MSSLEGLLPNDLLRHVQLNRHRLRTYDELRAEIMAICEDREGVVAGSGQPRQYGGSGGGTNTRMDVDSLVTQMSNLLGSFTSKGGKGKNKGGNGGGGGKGPTAKFEGSCHKCGKTGHKAADCWQGRGRSSTLSAGKSGTRPRSASAGGECYICGKKGHFAKECPNAAHGNQKGKNGGKGKNGKNGGKKP